jgi:predicted ATPase/DNA-binding SARP family transcriptional activator
MHAASATRGDARLPLELTTFIGREREAAELRRLLESTRLLTLTGAGGSGKTRLAMELAQSFAGQRAVAWVELAPLQQATHLTQSVAEACGIAEEGSDAAALVRLLHGRKLLLVLDNCEHIVDACANLADTLLRSCPDLTILATSREALGVRGERAWLVPPLPIADAVTLFVERARDFAGEFALTDSNRAAVEEICTRLDGIPLAIELAAARVRVLSPEQVRDRLDDAFRLLKSPARSPVPRHRTLGAAVEWSYNLLTAPERQLFHALAVFRGGFTLDAVEAVGAHALTGDADVLDTLTRLVDRSLVTTRDQHGGARFSLLEAVHQYARHQLSASGDEATIAAAHAAYVERIVTDAEPHFILSDRTVWIERLLADLDNIRAALNWTRAHDPERHARLAGSLWWFWFSTRHWMEAASVLDGALALPAAHAPTITRAKLLFGAGALAVLQARAAEGRTLLDEAVAIANACGDARLHAYAQNYLSMSYAAEGRPEATALSNAAATWFEANGDVYGQRLALVLLGLAAMNRGDFDEADRLHARAVTLARAFRQPRDLAIALHMHAAVHIARDDFASAQPLLVEALAEARKDPAYFSIAYTLDLLAEGIGLHGDALKAARIFGAAEGLRTAIAGRRFPFVEKRLATSLPRIRARADERAFERAWAAGRELTAEAIIDEIVGAAAPVSVEPEPPPATPAHATARLRVHALGRFGVAIDDEVIPYDAWAYGKPKELLVYLLCHPHGDTRDRIAAALWPSATAVQMKNSFHVTLHHLRKVLRHTDWIVAERGTYRIARDLAVSFDADVFARAAQQQDANITQLEAAVALYRGDLLEGEPAGEWVEEHLTRLRRLYFDVALRLGAAYEQAGNDDAAVALYQQLVARDGLQEEPHRRLMAIWSRNGDRTRALRHYERLIATLSEVLDADPEGSTVSLYERILADQPIERAPVE